MLIFSNFCQKLGIIKFCDLPSGEFISQIVPVPKLSGEIRIILNLKPLNEHIHFEQFKLENFNSVLNLVESNCYIASIDLKHAYYSVDIHLSD